MFAWFLLDDSGLAASCGYWDAVMIAYSWFYCRSFNKGGVTGSCAEQCMSQSMSEKLTFCSHMFFECLVLLLDSCSSLELPNWGDL